MVPLIADHDQETGAHLLRLGHYYHCLAAAAAGSFAFAPRVTASFLEMLVWGSALHDIGKVSVPGHLLRKPGPLDADERIRAQTHTTLGAAIVRWVGRLHGAAPAFWLTARHIARHHHERYDGHGYPDRLAGEAIPLAARLVAVCDVYDALRSRRSYKPPLSHAAAVRVLAEGSPGQFDPAFVRVFLTCAHHFDSIFCQCQDVAAGGDREGAGGRPAGDLTGLPAGTTWPESEGVDLG